MGRLRTLIDRITKLSGESVYFSDMFRPADVPPPFDRARELTDRQAIREFAWLDHEVAAVTEESRCR
ncbi:hypothetical protein [Nocardia pseudobrasiliensis]|uniref:Uncharacterized protein n=1 Tax=Nocardia pseudobrasiliensis TaxID=45979 RepID=A0A370I431_9NOCA|nr:hypothetical protein [Nocardia pseudobrasiliensis]RDI64084.1 hypothetical protein DFR76_109425 [Nocardia pseudobrasiliensis]